MPATNTPVSQHVQQRRLANPNINAVLPGIHFQAVALNPVEFNDYDFCLFQDLLAWEQLLEQGGLKKICKGSPEYLQPPWVSMPKEGRRFKPISTLLVSTAVPFTGMDIPVLQTRVPLGYDGVISDVVCEIMPGATGFTGFIEGSGDLTWRLSADNRYLRDLGNLKVTVGSLTSPSPVPRGMLRVYSHDLLTFSVAFAVGAEARIQPDANVICSITGWFWPR